MNEWVCDSRSVMSDCLRPHGLYSPWNSPGQNTAVGSLSLLQGIFPMQRLNPGLPHCRWILYQLSHKGSPNSRKFNQNAKIQHLTFQVQLLLSSRFVDPNLLTKSWQRTHSLGESHLRMSVCVWSSKPNSQYLWMSLLCCDWLFPKGSRS